MLRLGLIREFENKDGISVVLISKRGLDIELEAPNTGLLGGRGLLLEQIALAIDASGKHVLAG